MKHIILAAVLAALTPAAMAETRCYISLGASSTEGMRVTSAPDGTLWGSHFGVIHVQASGYFAAFDTWLIDGRRGGDGNVLFDTITEVDGDTQYGDQEWIITPDTAGQTGWPYRMEPAECEGLFERVQDIGASKVG